MDHLEVYSGLRVSRGRPFVSREKANESNTSDKKDALSDIILDRFGFFVFVSSAVALLMIVSFYFQFDYANTPAVEISAQKSTDQSVETTEIKPLAQVSRTFKYMLPASFETRKTDQQKAHQMGNFVSQVRFVTGLIKSNSRATQPNTLAKIIVSESARLGYDPLFVAAVIMAESRFDKKAISHAGALGLMQILPSTAKYITSKIKPSQWKGHNHLLVDEAYNINLGITYLQYLDAKFKGDKRHTLVAYNWGPGNMFRALKGESEIPSVSKKYRDSILSTYAKWQSQFVKTKAELATANLKFDVG